MMSTPRSFTSGNFRPSNQNSNNSRQNRSLERGDYTNNNKSRYNDYRARSQYQSDQDQYRNWGSNNNYSRSPSTSRQDSYFTDSRGQHRSNSTNLSVFNRFGSRDPSKNIPYDKKFPTSNNGNQPNVFWFTTTDNEFSELLGLSPFKLLRSPNSTTNESKNSRLSFNFFYFATGDTQKDSCLEIELMLDTGASSSIINYRTFWEICQTQHPKAVKRSTSQTRTYSGQVVPMIGFATLTFNYDPDGHFCFL